MRQLKKYNIIQRIIALFAILLTLSTVTIIKPVYAADDDSDSSELEGADEGDIGGILFGPISSLICGIGDACNKMLQLLLIGDNSPVFIDQGFWSNDKVNKFLQENPPDSNLETVDVVKDYIATWTGKGYGVPNIKLTSAEIFSGNVAALDANFFKTDADHDNELGGKEKSIVEDLKSTVAKWYVALRNIAIVGLLSVLLYIGIRIIISSSAGDKAKYKQFFVDWVVALCLIFFLHYIMAITMTMSETVTDVLAGATTEQGTIKQVNIRLTDKDGVDTIEEDGIERYFVSNFTGVARLKAQYSSSILEMGYSILYIALTVYTVYFAFVYLKRLLMLAFFTMIAPLVALTYPLDKIKDGKAQAFNFWFKEYMFYALLQPLHLLLYTVFVSSALSVASKNLLYSIIALAFIVPAEKIVKQMFGIKGQTESSIGGFAGGALAAQAFNALKSKAAGGGNKGGGQTANNNKIRQAKNPNSPDSMNTLAGDAAGLDQTALAAGTGAAIGAGAGAAMAEENVDTRGASAADAYQNSPDAVLAAEKEALEERLADGQIDESELTAEQRALLGMNSASPQDASNGNSPQTDTQTPDSTPQLTDQDDQFKDHKKTLANNFKKAVKNRWVRAGGMRGVAKAAAKGYGRAFGTVTMGALGLGAGIVGGDMSDTLKGLGAGLAAGTVVSKKTNQMAGNLLSGNTAVGRFTGDVLYGEDERIKKQFIKQYMNDPQTRDRIMDKNPDISVKELRSKQRAEAEMMYDTGISDYSSVKAAIDMEKTLSAEGKEPQVSHDMAVALAKLGQNYDNSTFVNQAKFEQAQKALQKRLEEQMKKNIEKQIDQQLSTANMSDTERATERQRRIAEQSANVSQQANAEATQSLERIRKMKKL